MKHREHVSLSDEQLLTGMQGSEMQRNSHALTSVGFGTEVVTNADKSISALLGASPGASVSVSVMLDVVKTCLTHLLESEDGAREIRRMIPTWDEDLIPASSAERFRQVSLDTDQLLALKETAMDLRTLTTRRNNEQ